MIAYFVIFFLKECYKLAAGEFELTPTWGSVILEKKSHQSHFFSFSK